MFVLAGESGSEPSLIKQRRLGSTKRMRAEHSRIQTKLTDPMKNQASVSTRRKMLGSTFPTTE
jgi:hypothetical protein